jgi:TonB family protein
MTAVAGGRRVQRALLASLLAHALLLSLSFGQGDGLPGLEFPWQKRRAEAAELRVVMEALPAPAPPAPSPVEPPEAPAAPPVAAAAAPADEAPAEARLLEPAEAPPAPPARALLAVERAPPDHWRVDTDPAVPTAAIAALSAASSPALEPLARSREALRPREDRSSELAQLAAPRADAAIAALSAASAAPLETLRRAATGLRLEKLPDSAGLDAAAPVRALPSTVVATLAAGAASAPAVEPLRRAGDGLRPNADGARASELAQLDAARQQAQQGAQRLEAARLDALRLEAARAEALRQEAARAEAARLEAARLEAARAEAARNEAARLEAARLAAAQAQAQAEDEQREARRRAMGRQLDAEAAQRDAERQRPDWTPARRGRLFGRADNNAALVTYGELWARKIEQNVNLDPLRETLGQPHADAMVTVAVRSNGSVESVTFVRSSGVPAVDDAIRRIVQSQENYPAFPPALLRDYDVVEIRRTWHFDMAIRLY